MTNLTSAVTQVAPSVTAVTLAADNPSRIGWSFVNDGASDCLIKFGTVASSTSYTARVPSGGGFYEVPSYSVRGVRVVWNGIITGIWVGAVTGTSMATEVSL